MTLITNDSVSVRLYPPSEAPSLATEWKRLEARAGAVGLACSWDWTETWINHYGDLVPFRFAVGKHAGGICGIALLAEGVGRKRGPFSVKAVHLGTAGEPPSESVYVENNRVLAAPEARHAFAAALVTAVRDEAGWDEFLLDGFAPAEAAPFLEAEPAFVARCEICPVLDLRRARELEDDVLATLKSGTRYQIRRSLRGFGPLETAWAENEVEALDIIDELASLHQKRWTRTGQPGAFSSPRFSGFHRDLILRLLPQKKVLLYRVRGAHGTIGCLYSFIEGDTVLFYQSGLASVDDNKLKPGLVAHTLCMQACLERGFNEYNFLAPDTPYKRSLSNDQRELVWARASRRRLRFILLSAIRRAGRLRGQGRQS
jgi:hypothetical protein